MDNETITSLAREYAEEICPENDYQEDIEWREDDIKRETSCVESLLKWLLRRYSLVEKSKAADLCRLTLEHDDSVDYELIDGLTDFVLEVFPEQYHQVVEGLSNPEIAKEVEK